jgi:hypothetical protein
MNLKRYNDWIIAIAGTAVGAIALYGLVRVTYEFLRSLGSHDQPPGIALHPMPTAKPTQQTVVYCEPILVAGSDTQLVPVAAVSTKDENEPVSVGYALARLSLRKYDSRPYYTNINCAVPGIDRAMRPFNLIVRNSRSNEQRLLLSAPAQVFGISAPPEDCKPEHSNVPCDALLLSIRDTDANKDGLLDEKDPVSLYVADPDLHALHRVSPEGWEVRNWIWDAHARSLVLLVSDGRKDVPTTDVLITHAPEWPEPVKLIDPALRAKLEAAIK